MKPHQVLLFIACVMGCLAVLCYVLPGQVRLGDYEVRWPTMAKVLGTEEGEKIEGLEALEALDTIEVPDSLEVIDTIVPEESRIIVPKVVVDESADSRIFLQAV